MNKRGLILKILAIGFIAIILLVLIVGIYLYYFHVFKEIKFCVGSQGRELNISCSTNSDCKDFMIQGFEASGDNSLTIAFDLFEEELTPIFESIAYCEETCKLNQFSVLGMGNDEENCPIETKESSIKLHGKEGLKILKLAPDLLGK